MFLYSNHMGGIYASDNELDADELYCESCGDSDWPLGEFSKWEDAIPIICSECCGIAVENNDCGYVAEFLYNDMIRFGLLDKSKTTFEDFCDFIKNTDQYKYWNVYGDEDED